jgi:hypothetical protein
MSTDVSEVHAASIIRAIIAIGPKVRGFKPGRERRIIKGDKTSQHDFLWKESKDFGYMS